MLTLEELGKIMLANYTWVELLSGYSLTEDATDAEIGEQALLWHDIDAYGVIL